MERSVIELTYQTTQLHLLPERAVYLSQAELLLVSDVHLGKSETFQQSGIPIPNCVNDRTLQRLTTLCQTYHPKQMIILGDLFHARLGFVDEVIQAWLNFLSTVQLKPQLLLGNHDRPLTNQLTLFNLECIDHPIELDDVILSHEPVTTQTKLNICGHVHPCFRYKSKLDDIRLPCFFYDRTAKTLILPSFGEFTGGYDVSLTPHTIAYAIAQQSIIPFEGTGRAQSTWRKKTQ
ncbi:ligase-associated DNA damage response endonuclease PdeM [Leptolyngbya sp. AN02str]|uniref:ligase-associated DNA damage response endonuclease PdeM n=1 Tax=Leptolyngbya sp. AN02str TaxID=3423363 RepID=UPI003D322859